MINLLAEEKIRKLIVQGRPNIIITEQTNVSLATVKKIRKTMKLVGCIDDLLKEQIIAKLCGGYTHREIADTMKIDMEIVSAIRRYCYFRSKRKTSRAPPTLCSVCKADIDSLNDVPCFETDAASDGDIAKEARTMFKVICDTVGLDSLCVVASPIFGAIAKEAGQIKKRILGEENAKEETDTI